MPKNGRLRFDTLLRVRRLQENLKSQELATVRREIHRTALERDDLIAQQRRMLEEAAQKMVRTFTVGEVRRFFQYERRLAQQAVEKDAAIVQLRRTEQGRLAELTVSTQRKRTVERLSERASDVYEAWVKKEAQAVTDETATNKAAVTRQGKRT